LSRRRVSHVCFDAPANDEAHLGFELPSPKKTQKKKTKQNQKTKKLVLQVQKKVAGFCRHSKAMISGLKLLEAKRRHPERLFRDEIEARAKLVEDPAHRQSLH
jgi:hypothetical protein